MKTATAIVFCVLTASQALAQSGPAQLPADAGNNTVLPVLERPQDGWPPRGEWPSRTEFCAPGLSANIRVSRITGDRAAYDKAQADHQAWYEAHEYTDTRIIALPVILPNLENGTMEADSEISISVAVYGDAGGVSVQETLAEDPEAKAAWDSFVKVYAANSEVIESAWTCFPRELLSKYQD